MYILVSCRTVSISRVTHSACKYPKYRAYAALKRVMGEAMPGSMATSHHKDNYGTKANKKG